MRKRLHSFIRRLALAGIAAVAVGIFGGTVAMADTLVYRVSVSGGAGRSIEVRKSGDEINLVLNGFGDRSKIYRATSGGTSACRTIIEHSSSGVSILLSLAVPDPRSRCRAVPGYASINIGSERIWIDEAGVKRTAGSNSTLRKTIRGAFGSLDTDER